MAGAGLWSERTKSGSSQTTASNSPVRGGHVTLVTARIARWECERARRRRSAPVVRMPGQRRGGQERTGGEEVVDGRDFDPGPVAPDRGWGGDNPECVAVAAGVQGVDRRGGGGPGLDVWGHLPKGVARGGLNTQVRGADGHDGGGVSVGAGGAGAPT